MKIKKWGIYWIDLTNVNDFKKGFRPCLIISNNIINKTSDTISFIPLKTYKGETINKISDMTFFIQNKKPVENYLSVNNLYTINKNKVGSYLGYMKLKDTKMVKRLFKNTLLKG